MPTFHLTSYAAMAMVAYALLLTGLFERKNVKRHAKLMAGGIVIDLVIVLMLEGSRHVLATAADWSMTPYQKAHIVTSTLALALYVPTVILGLRLLMKKGSLGTRKWHIRVAISAFAFRTLGLFLMFSFLIPE